MSFVFSINDVRSNDITLKKQVNKNHLEDDQRSKVDGFPKQYIGTVQSGLKSDVQMWERAVKIQKHHFRQLFTLVCFALP